MRITGTDHPCSSGVQRRSDTSMLSLASGACWRQDGLPTLKDGSNGNWGSVWFLLLLTLLMVAAAAACGDPEPVEPTAIALAMTGMDATPTSTDAVPTPAVTPVPAVPTSTPLPTPTAAPTSTPVPTATAVAAAPTSTPVPTATAVAAAPTSTPVPPALPGSWCRPQRSCPPALPCPRRRQFLRRFRRPARRFRWW